MNKKHILQELCSNLERELNDRKETNHIRTVEFFSGLKPSDYYLPHWFVEIGIDGKCIFRESYIPKEDEDLKIVEEFMINRILRNIFNFGVMSSKQMIEKMDNQNTP